jgi:hypothetical protein
MELTMAADPATLPKYDDWQAQKLAQALKLADMTPSGVQCPKSVSELLMVPGTEASAQLAGLVLATIEVVCPDDGFKGVLYL